MGEKMYYTQSELAEMFRVSPSTIINWRRLGHLEYFKPSGSKRILYPVSGVEQFIKDSTYREEVVKNLLERKKTDRRAAPKTDWRI